MDENIHLEGVDFENETPLITAPVGYGKSYYAVHCLPGLIAKAIGRPVRNILMLTPTRAVLEQICDEYNSEVAVANGYDYVDCGEYFDGKVRVACFASPANFIADGNKINQSYDLVIIDEIDLIVRWAVYFPGYLDAFDWLKSKRKETVVCGLTATPSLLLDYVSGDARILR
jgi:superfamily II DNA or RNA helicase